MELDLSEIIRAVQPSADIRSVAVIGSDTEDDEATGPVTAVFFDRVFLQSDGIGEILARLSRTARLILLGDSGERRRADLPAMCVIDLPYQDRNIIEILQSFVPGVPERP